MNVALIGLRQAEKYNFSKLRELGFKFHLFVDHNEYKLAKAKQLLDDSTFLVECKTDDGLLHYLDKGQLIKLIDKLDISDDLLVLCSDEANVMVAAELREHYGLSSGPRPAELKPYRDKIYSKKQLSGTSVSYPRYKEVKDIKRLPRDFSELQASIGKKIIFKPSQSAGSWKVFTIDNQADYEVFLEQAPRNIVFNAEEFIEGKFYHCDTLYVNGELKFIELCEYPPNLDFQKNHPLYSLVYLEQDEFSEKLKRTCKESLQALGLLNGLQHTEFMVSQNGDIYFIESNARAPGLGITSSYEDIFGINLLEMELSYISGVFEYKAMERSAYSAFINFPIKQGRLKDISLPKIDSDLSVNQLIQVGQSMPPCRSNADIALACYLKADSYETLKSELEVLISSDPVQVI